MNAEINVAILGLYRHMWTHKWDGNYWGKRMIFPAIIIGKIYYLDIRIPFLSFDLHPASEPYDIGV